MALSLKSSKKTPQEEIKKLKQWYAEMLKRKDKEIDELKHTNEMLMKTALKRAETNEQLRAALQELRESLKEKNSEKQNK